MTRTRWTTTAAVLALSACAFGAQPSVAAAGHSGPTGALALGVDAIVTSVHVPSAAEPVYVSRSYDYSLYGTCWSKTGRPRLDMVQFMGHARVPAGAGGYQMRLPHEPRTVFTFTDPAGMLAHPVSPTRAVSCPRNLVPGVYRASIGEWRVSVLQHGGAEVLLTGDAALDLHFRAP